MQGCWGIAVEGTQLFWANAFSTTLMALDLGSGQSSLFALNQNGPDVVALDVTEVYWANYFGGQLLRAPRAGGTPELVADLATQTGYSHLRSLALDATHVYVVAENNTQGGLGALLKVPR
jgi:hypothetical protein